MVPLLLAGLLVLAQDSSDRVAGWHSDLAFLLREARRLHAHPSRPAHQPGFERAVRELSEKVPDLSNERMVIEIQRLLALLGDGHSLVYLMSTEKIPLSRMPIDLYWFADGLFVIGGIGEGEHLVGTRVVRIGNRPVEALLQQLEPYISRDNAMASKTFGPFYLTVPAFLQALGMPVGPISLTLTDSSGRTRTVSLPAGRMRPPLRKLAAPARAPARVPLYLKRVDDPYWLGRLDQPGVLYFQFNQVTNGQGESLAGFAARLADSLRGSGASTLIVDVRHNNGGNNMLLAPLVQSLGDFARARGNRIYLLTSRTTFSAAQNFITRVERTAHPVFAGEPSASSPNFTGEDNPVRLPWSGVTVSISNRHWQDSDPGDRRPWIAPRLAVELNSSDYFDNRDPVMTAVLADVARSRRAIP